MPIPYDTLEAVVTASRVRLNDAIQQVGGEVLTDNAGFSIVAINAAWRRWQDLAADLGVFKFLDETLVLNLPATTNADPGVFQWLNWTNLFDGMNNLASSYFPNTFIEPLEIWERPHATPFAPYWPMDRLYRALPSVTKDAYNRIWEWRNERLYIPGATQATDLRIRFAAYLADFLDNGTSPFSAQNVPIVRALNPLAYAICAEVARPRGDVDAGWFDQQAILATEQMVRRASQPQREIGKPAEFGRMMDARTPKDPAGDPIQSRGTVMGG